MATIGQRLTAPESGWKRYNSTDLAFAYISGRYYSNDTASYNSDYMDAVQCYFSFTGTRLRIIAPKSTWGMIDDYCIIDGVEYTFSTKSATTTMQVLVAEITGLQDTVHRVFMKAQYFDCIDIDSNGKLVHYLLDEKTTIEDMEIGDCIPCRYRAPVSGAVGEFSELGTCTTSEIPKEGNVATPNGKFNFIKADKGLLIADRVIQTNISWQTLNNGGLIEGTLVKQGAIFNGVNTYGEIPYTPELAPAKISLKAKIARYDWTPLLTTPQKILSKFHGGGYGIQLNTNGDLQFQVYSNGGYRTANFAYNQLSPGEHTIYGLYDGRYVNLYIDGDLKSTFDVGSTYDITYAYNNSLIFGADAGGTTGADPNTPHFLSANILEVAIWNKAIDPLTTPDYLSGNETGLIGLWKFEASGENKVYDKKNNNHITLYNHSWAIPTSGKSEEVLYRSLSGGCVYADENGNPTFTDSLQGAFPTSNEYDTYIKKSTLDGKITAGDNNIWNYGKTASMCKGSPMIGAWTNRIGQVSAVMTNLRRMIRGNDNRTDGSEWKDVNSLTSDFQTVTYGGFRPVLEFIEPDSLQENTYY